MSPSEELQDVYDRALLRGWRKRWKFWQVAKAFRAEAMLMGLWDGNGQHDDEIMRIFDLGLRRINTETFFLRCQVTYIVARNFHGLSEMLWDGADDETALRKLKASTIRNTERGRDNEVRREARRLRTTRTINMEQSIGRRNMWGMTKPVRSK